MKLLRYYKQSISEVIKTMKDQEVKDYLVLQRAILKEYKEYNTYQQKFSIHFLETFKLKLQTNNNNLLYYYQIYHTIAKELIAQGVLSNYITRIQFLHRLPPTIATKVVRKYKIDIEVPTMVNYNTIQEFVVKATSAKRAMQKVNNKRASNSS